MKHAAAFGALTMAFALVPMLAPSASAGNAISTSPATVPNASGRELAARLAAAKTGDTVVVRPGNYRGNFVVRTPITLRGTGRPVLDGGGNGTVLTIGVEAADTTVRGLRLVGSGPGPLETPSGLRVEADNVTVEDLEVADTYMGIQVMGARSARVAGNTIEGFADGRAEGEAHATGDAADMTGIDHANSASSGAKMRGDAITLWNSTGASVEGNTVRDARDGIFMSFARDTVIRDNDVRDSRYAIHGMYASKLRANHNYFDNNLTGAILMYGGPFEVRANTIVHSRSQSTGIGLVLKDGSGVTIVDNVIAANRVGIKLDNGGATSSSDSVPATLRANTIGLNQIGVEIMRASRARFTRNSFVENTIQVITDGEVPNVEWTLAGFGNYWSNYKGYDTAGDGVGDVPFVEGGSIERTLARSPVMMALASGPAFRLLQAVEDRWAPENPVVLDPSPLTEMHSPTMVSTRSSEPVGLAFGLAGGTIAVLSWLVLWRARASRAEVRYV